MTELQPLACCKQQLFVLPVYKIHPVFLKWIFLCFPLQIWWPVNQREEFLLWLTFLMNFLLKYNIYEKGHKSFCMRWCMCSEAREQGVSVSILYLTPWDRLSLDLELGWWSGHPSASPFFPPHSAEGTGGHSQVFIWVLWLLLCWKCSYPLNHIPCPTNRILQLYKIFYTSSLKRTRKRIKLRPSNNLMPAPLSIWESPASKCSLSKNLCSLCWFQTLRNPFALTSLRYRHVPQCPRWG